QSVNTGPQLEQPAVGEEVRGEIVAFVYRREEFVSQTAAQRQARARLPVVVDEHADRLLAHVPLGLSEGSRRAFKARQEQADERVDVAAASAVCRQARTCLIADAAVVGVIPAGTHLDVPVASRGRLR